MDEAQIKTQLTKLQKKLGDKRRTEIIQACKDSGHQDIADLITKEDCDLEETTLKLSLLQALESYKRFINWCSATYSKHSKQIIEVASKLFANEKNSIVSTKIKELAHNKLVMKQDSISPQDIQRYGCLKSNTFKVQMRGVGAFEEKNRQLHKKETTIKRARRTLEVGHDINVIKKDVYDKLGIDFLYDKKYINIDISKKITAFNIAFKDMQRRSTKLDELGKAQKFIVYYDKQLKI